MQKINRLGKTTSSDLRGAILDGWVLPREIVSAFLSSKPLNPRQVEVVTKHLASKGFREGTHYHWEDAQST